MSAVCILAPVVIAAWPAFSAAVMAAAASLGYQVAADAAAAKSSEVKKQAGQVQLEMANSEIVTNQLGRDQRIQVTRDGVTVTFSRDARGRASLCVTGHGMKDAALQAMGEELSQRVVQKYVYQKLLDEMRARGFVVVDEQTDAQHAIRLKVRHWEG
ncbi:exported hypothetical protein [Verrucomicrobia bacterium]|nr:exported hypothetical protein [Verrucomicrobiota bacterium]